MKFHWLTGHKHELNKLFYRAEIENIYGAIYYKITAFGYCVCSCGKTKIVPLKITDVSMDEKRFEEKINYLRSLGYVDDMEFYGWLAYETSQEQKTETIDTEKKE